MSKIKLFLVLTFILVCAAGVGVGMIVDQRLRPVTTRVDHHPHGPLDELKLTPEQSQKWGDIWSEVKKLRDQRFKDRHDLSQKRDAEIVALLTPSQKSDYDKIQESYRASVKESEDSLQKAVQVAEDETRAMLTPEQLPIYEKIRNHMGPPGRDGRGRGGRNRNRSTTQPATQPANTAAASTVS
jgi:hypothetical protein